MNVSKFQDIYGKIFYVSDNEVIKALDLSHFKIYGVDLECLLALLNLYQSLGGNMPVNEKNIAKVLKEQQQDK